MNQAEIRNRMMDTGFLAQPALIAAERKKDYLKVLFLPSHNDRLLGTQLPADVAPPAFR